MSISHENLAEAAKTYDPTKPIYMLNLLKYRSIADYAQYLSSSTSSTIDSSSCTGREAVDRYRAGIRAVLPPNTSVHFMATVAAHVIAPKGEEWDDAFIIKYEDLAGFRKMVSSEQYKKEVEPHRLAGLADSRLIMLDQVVV